MKATYFCKFVTFKVLFSLLYDAGVPQPGLPQKEISSPSSW